jgi:transcriptional regulator with XRE-family HTH domain
MTINSRIKEIRLATGLSQDKFAPTIGLTRGNYAQLEIGKQKPSLETLALVVRNYNKSYEWLIDGVEQLEKIAPKTAPIVAPNEQKRGLELLPKAITVDTSDRELVTLVPMKAAAGYLNGFADPEYIGSLPTLDIPGLSGQTHRAFEIRGHSMMPNIHSGSISIGRWVENINDIQDRHVYIIVTKQDGVVCKRVLNRVKQDGVLVMISDNDNKREFPNYTVYPEEILELWYWRAGIIRTIPEPGTQHTRINDLEARMSLIEQRLNNR